MVLRFDTHRLDKVQGLAAGGALVPARISRTGIQVYRKADGTEIREYRPPEEVFAPEALASFFSAPVTVGHPRGGRVDASNWRELSHGTVVDVGEREKVDADEYMRAKLAIQSAEALEGIGRGDWTELSCGYACDVVDEPGVTPEGERYDCRQTNIRANHVALLPPGFARAGKHARLTLDGNQHTTEEKRMKIRLDGIEFDTASEADMSALQKRIDENAKTRNDATDRVSELERENGVLEGKLDAAQKSADSVDERVDAAVVEELRFREDMRELLPAGYDFTGKDRRSVKIDAIKNRAPDASILKIENPADARLDGAIDFLRDQGAPEKKIEKDDGNDWRSDHASIAARHRELTKGYDPQAEKH